MLVMFLIGLMFSVQFNMNFKNTENPSAKNIWQLRDSIAEGQDIQMQLVDEIARYNQILREYEENNDTERRDTLKKTLQELRNDVGITEVKGEGIIIHIEPFLTDSQKEIPRLQADLLSQLINELNKYDVTHMAINDERVTVITSIRNVNGKVYVNNKAISSLPVTVEVLTEEPEKLVNELNYSLIMDQFAIEDLLLQMEIKESVLLPKSNFLLNGGYMKEIDELNEGEE